MKNPFLDAPAPPPVPPVRVVEVIPVAESPGLPAALVAEEKIPTPPHLVVRRELGRGAMGHVHPASDRNLLRDVALKRLDKSLLGKAFYRDAFVAEAQITGQLEHPNIVPVHELAIDERGVPYFTMKLVQGTSFDTWLAARKPGTVERVELVEAVRVGQEPAERREVSSHDRGNRHARLPADRPGSGRPPLGGLERPIP